MIRAFVLYINVAISLCLLCCCKVLDKTPPIHAKNLPSGFQSQTDTLNNFASSSWRNFFSDSLLQQLIDTALLYNPDVQIATQKIEIARASFKFQRAELLPKLNAGLNLSLRKFGLYTMDGAGNIVTEITPGKIVPIHLPDFNPTFQAQWEIDIWGKLRNLKKAARANFLASEEIKHAVTSALVAEIANSYYELLAADNELVIIRETIKKQQEALDVIKLQKEAARSNELAIQQFKAQLHATQSMEYEVLQKILLIENRINFLVGRFPQPVARSKISIWDSISVFTTGVPSQLLQNRPDIKAAQQLVRASFFQLKASKAAFFPNINVGGGIGFQSFSPELLFVFPASVAYAILGSLFAPILNMNANLAQYRIAKANQISSLYEYQKTLLVAYTEVENEINNLRYLSGNISFKRLQAQTMQDAVFTSRELYKAGKAGYLEVLVSQQNYLMSNLELINSIKRQQQALVNLYRALGGGWK